MSEMIERVARAIKRRASGGGYYVGNPEEIARAVIQAMREPTEAMLKSALGEAYESDRFEAATVYSAIIGAALEPKEPG